jgi:hypothetical protein
MFTQCIEVQEWIEEEISKPIEEWVEKTEEKCKKRPWYDPRRWLCWLVTTLTKVVTWVLVKVGKWFVRTICKLTYAAGGFYLNYFIAKMLQVLHWMRPNKHGTTLSSIFLRHAWEEIR